MKLDENKRLKIKAEKASEQSIVDKYLKDMESTGEFTPFLLPIDIDPPQKEMSRFLAMLALEALALRFSYGNAEDIIIDESSYDLIRNYARYGKGPEEWPYHRQVLYPMDTLMKHSETGEWVQIGFGHDIILTPHPETYVSFHLYGVQFTINVGGPSIHGYKMWLENNDPLERTGSKLVRKVVDGQEKFYLEGDFCTKTGKEYDRKNWLND